MKIPFVTFKPMEAELDKELREAFDRVYTRSWYIEGVEDEAFEKAFGRLKKISKKCLTKSTTFGIMIELSERRASRTLKIEQY